MRVRGVSMFRFAGALVLLLGAVTGCQSSQMARARQVTLASPALQFETLFVGQSTIGDLEILNRGWEPVSVTFGLPVPAFEPLDLPTLLAPGSTHVGIRFQPGRPGDFFSTLQILVEG